MKIPREIDELMWDVAELDDLETIDQFGSRYPEFRNELVKRIQMVRSLRSSRPNSSTPTFVPRQEVRNLGPSKLAVASVAVLVVFSVAFAGYATVRFAKSNERPTATAPSNAVAINPSRTVTDGSVREGNVDPTQVDATSGTSLPDGSVLPLREFDAFNFKLTVESSNTTLIDVINQITRESGIETVIAPGFEDERIRLSFIEQPAIGILEELGLMFGFTPIRQGSTSLLIVPAVDTSAQSQRLAYGRAERLGTERTSSTEATVGGQSTVGDDELPTAPDQDDNSQDNSAL